jgi:hypothetical protein
MSLTGHIVGRLQNDAVAANLRTLCRFGLRALGKGGSLLGSYAVLPLDHRAVVSRAGRGNLDRAISGVSA